MLQIDSLSGLLVAIAAGGVLCFLPGFAIAKFLDRIAPCQGGWIGFSPALGFVLLPVLDALLTTFGHSVMPILTLRALLGCAGAITLWTKRRERLVPPVVLIGAGVWLLYLGMVNLDVIIVGHRYQPINVLDMVKHSAVVREIALNGLPLVDPFFARDTPAGYYHYFYDQAAAVMVSGRGAVDPRMAFVGVSFWAGIGLAALARAMFAQLGWQRVSDQRLWIMLMVLLGTGGLDLFGLIGRYLAFGTLEPSSEWWDDEIALFPTSASWVPHHLSALLAIMFALSVFARAHQSRVLQTRLVLLAIGGLAMASAFGMSVWVTITAALLLAYSPRLFIKDRPFIWVGSLMFAGVIALALSFIQIRLLMTSPAISSGHGPIAVGMRDPFLAEVTLGHPLNPLLAFALTPVAWALEFGAFGAGALAFHMGKARSANFATDLPLARLLGLSAVIGLVVNLTLKSTIINNDLGWRAALLVEFPALLWTLAIIQHPVRKWPYRKLFLALIALGWASTFYNAVAAQLVRAPSAKYRLNYINTDPELDAQMAELYFWANSHLPAESILQHNPWSNDRMIDFGLYGRFRVDVADRYASLFGANPQAVHDRVAVWRAIFDAKAPPPFRAGLYLVITDHDALFAHVPLSHCLFRTARVCLYQASIQ